MSMIEQQVKNLKEMAIRQRNNAKVSEKVFFEIGNALSQASDTIEALSAKLAAANMEQSDRYYVGGWIACDKNNLPGEEVLCCDKYGEMILGYISEDEESETGFCAENDNEYMYNCVKWIEKPKP